MLTISPNSNFQQNWHFKKCLDFDKTSNFCVIKILPISNTEFPQFMLP